jgi:hypothetical protein
MGVLRALLIVMGASLVTGCMALQGGTEVGEANAVATAGTSNLDASGSDQLVCKQVITTGSRLRSRRCLTVRQWEMIQEGADQAVDEIQRRASHQQDMPGNGS